MVAATTGTAGVPVAAVVSAGATGGLPAIGGGRGLLCVALSGCMNDADGSAT